MTDNKIKDFRITNKLQVQVNIGKWVDLIVFNDTCPYGKYGYKTKVKKPFNPYVFFNTSECETIQKFLAKTISNTH